jgi:acyl-CoA synthetase (AMP-forming)/AMP-acid ligase II/acyl carrier protein
MAVLREHAVGRPDRPAVSVVGYDRDLDGATTTWTYAELDWRARAVAARLLRRCEPGDAAAIACPHGLDYVAAFLGCLYAGVRAVPLYVPDTVRDNSRLARLVADAAPRCVLTTSAALPAVERFLAGVPGERVPALCVDGVEPADAAAWRAPAVTGDTVAYLQYTSGSTAAPRGVMVTHANLAHMAWQCFRAFDLGSHTVSVSWLPLFHDLGLASAVTVPLFHGLSAVTMAPFAFVRRPARWLRLIDRHRATFTAVPNFALDLCVDRIGEDELRGVDLSCLRVLVSGAEPVRPHSLRRFTHAFGSHGLRHGVHTPCYGLAEATVLVSAVGHDDEPTVLACDRAALATCEARPAAAPAEGVQEVVSVGQPVDQRVAVVDPDTRRRLPHGRVGEIWVCGPNVTAGYHNRPEQTEAVFHARLGGSTDGRRWLRTGDLGFLHEGRLYLSGRLKNVIIIDGRNHDPADIEATVEAADDRLRPGGVVAFGVDQADQGDQAAERLVVVAEVDPRSAGRDGWDEAGLRRAVRVAVARHHGIEVHELLLARKGSITKTSSGKLARDACRRRYLDGGFQPAVATRPAVTRPASNRPAAIRPASTGPGRDEVERWLLERVAERLGVPAGEVDPRGVLADHGFSSKDVVAFSGDIERRWGVSVPATLLWEYPTIRALSAHLAAPRTATADRPAAATAFDDLLRTVERSSDGGGGA